MRRLSAGILTVFGAAMAGASGGPCPNPKVWSDAPGDAEARPTDNGAARAFDESALPDLLEVRLTAWDTPTPTTNPYAGGPVKQGSAHLVRMDVVFAGLVSPPGPLSAGAGGFAPFTFGPRPAYGNIEIDVDGQRDTGGELEPVAWYRWLSVVGRFGALPAGSIGGRACRSIGEYDGDFFAGRQFERSGAEFALTFCGCFTPTIVSQDGDADGQFDAGETWLVRGRFFERFQALKPWSGVSGGSEAGAYDPRVRLRYAHDTGTDRTTVSLVYPLDMAGAAMLEGEPEEPSDFDVYNHFSVEEALDDVICAANGAYGGIGDARVEELAGAWAGRDSGDFLDPTQWDLTAHVGGSYSSSGTALYVWSDFGFSAAAGDFTGEGVVSLADATEWTLQRDALDGTGFDQDGVVNGSVDINLHAWNFSLYDLNADGYVDAGDAADLLGALAPPEDINEDCVVNTADLGLLLNGFGTFDDGADINGDGVVDTADLGLLLMAFGQTCD